MKRLGLVRALKGALVFMAVMTAVCYLEIFPDRITMAGRMYGMEWMVAPGILSRDLGTIFVGGEAVEAGLYQQTGGIREAMQVLYEKIRQ